MGGLRSVSHGGISCGRIEARKRTAILLARSRIAYVNRRGSRSPTVLIAGLKRRRYNWLVSEGAPGVYRSWQRRMVRLQRRRGE